MEPTNLFKTNPYNNTLVLDWGQLNQMMGRNTQPIETVDQYVDWVRQWKVDYKVMTDSIRYTKWSKNQAKATGDSTGCNIAWSSRMMLRTYARRLSETRAANKATLKQGKYKALEVA